MSLLNIGKILLCLTLIILFSPVFPMKALPRNMHNTDGKDRNNCNTCWMNSTLQCLRRLRPLKELMKSFRKQPSKSISEKKHRRIVELYKNISALLRKQYHGEKKFFPRKFYKAVIDAYFPGMTGAFNNASRFLSNFLVSLHEVFGDRTVNDLLGIVGETGQIGDILVLYPWKVDPPRTLHNVLLSKSYSIRTLQEMTDLLQWEAAQKYTKATVGAKFDEQGLEIIKTGNVLIIEHMKLDPDQPDDESYLKNSAFAFSQELAINNVTYELRSIVLYAHAFHYVALIKVNEIWYKLDALAEKAYKVSSKRLNHLMEGHDLSGYYPYLFFYEKIEPLQCALRTLKRRLVGLKDRLKLLQEKLEELKQQLLIH